MLKQHIKSEELLSDLAFEMNTYEDELLDDGHVEIELFDGYQARKGFDFDVFVKVYSDETDEVASFLFFSYTLDSEDHAQALLTPVRDLIKGGKQA